MTKNTQYTLVHTLQFAEWIAERYNVIGSESGCWCAKQYDQTDSDKYQLTGEIWAYWNENIRNA